MVHNNIIMKARIEFTPNLKGTIVASPSKNYTTRYLLTACLSDGESVVRNPSNNDDARALIECCCALGAKITERDNALIIKGFGKHPEIPPEPLNPHNAGAVLRFLVGIGALLPAIGFVTDFPDSLGTRPNQPLLDALAQLGVRNESNNGRLPITLYGGNLPGGLVTVSGSISSQFISSLLFLAPLIGEDLIIEVEGGLKSKPAVRQTLEVLRKAGIEVIARDDLLHFLVPGAQDYKAGEYVVNGDYPGSAAVLSAAAVCPDSDVTIKNLYRDEQGERAIVDVLTSMGADVECGDDYVRVKGAECIEGVEFNGDTATDAVLAMVGAASFARGASRFYNVENLRYKECNRIEAPVQELKKIGVDALGRTSEIIINGKPAGYEGGIEVSSHDDHRVIMLLTIVGLRCRRGLTISNVEHISKSYPDFFSDMQQLGAQIQIHN